MTPHSILLTGSSGTIGTELAIRLLDDGYDVHGVDVGPNRWSDRVNEITKILDLTDPETVSRLPSDADMVIHLAANARVHNLVKRPKGAKENIDMTFNILEHARTQDIPKVMFSSSREVYGNKDKTIYSEEDTFADECESPYTASKISGESLLDAYQECYDINSSTLRFSNVYGKYDASNRVVPLFIAQASRGKDLTVYGEDKLLDFTHVDDCVNGIHRAIRDFHKISGTTINIASGEGTSLLELAEAVIERTATDVEVSVKPNRTGEVSRYISEITRAQKILGYEPTYSFEEGLDKAITWYNKNDQLFNEIVNK